MFAATVLPLVCTPGPDLIYIAAQALSGGRKAALRANAGVMLGYVTHAVLAALGVAALLAASPFLFEALRWCGVTYLTYLAIRMIWSAIAGKGISMNPNASPASLARGFMTSFFNPKGLLVYLAILPNFMNPGEPIAQQAILLSGVFVGLCALVYGAVGIAVAAIGRVGTVRASYQRVADGIAGGLLAFAAVSMARS
ncbi:LysE family translocator [Bradyrhizobium tropiciagri]|uniref:LysE family translocator n=1 Tax=Bradyrhizobium tropiciagri TaxID=312253 RepID=UPI002013BDE0|nr:LysE family translocator [Bradyrhizobium tropiciagri]